MNRITSGSGKERVRKEANGLEVTVTLHGASHEVRYGKSFFVSWTAAFDAIRRRLDRLEQLAFGS